MRDAYGAATWASAPWQADAFAWVDAQLASREISRTGEPEQTHNRPWATVFRIPTSVGIVWFKAAAPGTSFEIRLYPLLAAVAPEDILPPLAIDAKRSWIVLPDGGETFGDQLERGEIDELAAFTVIVPRWAALQRRLAPQMEAMVDLGVADMRPGRLAERFRKALASVEPWVEANGTDEDRERFGHLLTHEPTVREMAGRLAGGPVPPSLDHNDLHPWNVFTGVDAGGHPRIYDWGDSVVAHPFTSLLVPLTFLRSRLGTTDDDPRLLRIRDGYLAGFADLATGEELVATAELACRLGHIGRCLIWERPIGWMGDDEHAAALAAQPFRNLCYLLDDSYLGAHSIWSGFGV